MKNIIHLDNDIKIFKPEKISNQWADVPRLNPIIARPRNDIARMIFPILKQNKSVPILFQPPIIPQIPKNINMLLNMYRAINIPSDGLDFSYYIYIH